jgi:CheY-like chemotaxis protein/anti-sigma regulatory factor (Ser/Thr protein kinase)
MLALINDVLEMSRIENGKLDLEPEPCDIVEMMDDLRDMFQTQMDAKGVAFAVTTSDVRDRYVSCDTVRLNRVLLNLVSNAYKFTPEDGVVRVVLSQLEDAAEGQGTYEISVSDTGIGMSEEFAERVFDAFERERTTTASGIQGTGLGMAITKRIVDMMGGSIVVQSKEGEGTTFVVTLPFELSDGQDEPAVTDQERDAEPVDLEGLRILLAEDNEINREIAILLLEELGFEVEAVVNGQEAVDALVKAGPGHFDIVVTDIQMPVLNGLDEARAIRALDDRELARIPIVAMSANAFQEDVRAAYDAGIDGYTAKPIDVGALLDELERVMHAKKG